MWLVQRHFTPESDKNFTLKSFIFFAIHEECNVFSPKLL